MVEKNCCSGSNEISYVLMHDVFVAKNFKFEKSFRSLESIQSYLKSVFLVKSVSISLYVGFKKIV